MNIADRINNLRKSKGISQEELADIIGVSRQTVSKWESEHSVPDIDKVIILSDYFEVTTDYILKGIETQKQIKGRPLDANIFLGFATAMNFIGLILASAIWYENQVPMAHVIGLIFMAFGSVGFSVGVANSTFNLEKAKRSFWAINIWLLSFLPLSFIYNILFTGSSAPYPLMGGSVIAFPLFWLVYIFICLGVNLMLVKTKRRN